MGEPKDMLWRGIESAPNDGTSVLVSAKGRVWISSRREGRITRDGYGPFDGHDWWVGEAGLDPTHWMPLPEAPTDG